MMKTRVAVLFAIVTLWGAGRAPAGAGDPPTLSEIFTPVSVSGLGSGVLISPDGKVLTAAHVVQTAPVFVVGAPLGASHTLTTPAQSPAQP